mmetsp:Transcript_6634/g.19455  ORF Transcript_6634/g.19455 Transcript_6634/m.19455 type:complete len:111 (+) Transcript_6634:237-569(+)
MVLECNTDPNVVDRFSGGTPLHHAVEQQNLTMAKCLLLQCNADPNIADFCGDTPLHGAVRKNKLEVAQCLMFCGNANILCENTQGFTPLSLASTNMGIRIFTDMLRRLDK